MYSIKQISFNDIQDTTYDFSERNDTYAISFNNKIIAYTQFKITNNNMYLDLIEVITKRNGHGSNIIKWLINYYDLKEMQGFCLLEERAMNFWKNIGAELYYIDIEGYTIQELLEDGMETPFKLSA